MLCSPDGDFTAMLLPWYTLLFSNSPDHSLYSLGLITWNLKGWESRVKGNWSTVPAWMHMEYMKNTCPKYTGH